MDETPHGWLVIDKPHGMTSRSAVDRAAKWFPPGTALGHTGTLDPLATGVLVLAVGRATRLAEYVQQLSKGYDAEFTLGATSATDDAEGPITPTANAANPGRLAVAEALESFLGVTDQVPPAYSAAKVAGRRSYQRARAGAAVLPKPKPVRIDRIDLLDYAIPTLRLRITCGKGTYVRSVARDLGARLGCGGYVAALRRTAVGSFTPAEATSLDADSPRLLPFERGVDALARVTIREPDVRRFRLGQTIVAPEPTTTGTELACFDRDGRLVAVARPLANGRLQPVKVLYDSTG
jgi:tRNA pseudouridine55 synthase